MITRESRAFSFTALVALLGACGAEEASTVDASGADDRLAVIDATGDLSAPRDVAPSDLPAPVDAISDVVDPHLRPDGTALSDVLLQGDAAELDASDVEMGADVPANDVPPSAFHNSYPVSARFAEGGAFDPRSNSFFVGSLATGTVHRIDAATGAERMVFRESAPGTWWTLGMDVHPERRRLAVCAMDDRRDEGNSDHPYDGYVWVFDLDTGERVARHPLSAAFGTATCTDVAFASDGTLYVSDREHPNLYRISTAGAVSTFVSHSLLAGGVIGQNALVMLPDQSALLSLIYLPSRLVRVSLRDRSVANVSLSGTFFDGLPPLSGADGMTLSGGNLLVAFTSQVTRVSPTFADWSAARTSTLDVPSGMTDILHTPAGDYLLNGQSLVFALGATPAPTRLARFTGSF